MDLTMLKRSAVLIIFLTAYCVQPILVDIIKVNGGAHASTFLFLLPHYYSMALVGLLPTKQKLSECDWRKGILVSSLDILNQLIKKAGLIYAGAAVYIVVDSSSMVWTAIWSRLLLERRLVPLQWLAIVMISSGIALKACLLKFSFDDDEFLGVALILLASILMGMTFVLNERFMKGDKPIEGPNLVCMMGICCSSVLTVWTIFWTVPQFDELVVENIRQTGGSYSAVVACFVLLLLAGWVHSGTLWYLMRLLGAVSIGVLKGLKVAVVFVLSHFLFCKFQPSQCLNLYTAASALVCVLGVILYSVVTANVEEKKMLSRSFEAAAAAASVSATNCASGSANRCNTQNGGGIPQQTQGHQQSPNKQPLQQLQQKHGLVHHIHPPIYYHQKHSHGSNSSPSTAASSVSTSIALAATSTSMASDSTSCL